MRFNPLSEQELKEKEFSPLPEGEYNFQIIEAEDTISRSGNEMLKVVIGISKDDRRRLVYDYLLEKMPTKLKGFCDSVGLNYASGSISAQACYGRTGKAKIIIDEFNGKKNNKVAFYLPSEPQKPNEQKQQYQIQDEEYIPF